MKDVLGIILKEGDAVYDIGFHKQGVVRAFTSGYSGDYILVLFEGYNKDILKQGRSLISLEPHKISNPEIFL